MAKYKLFVDTCSDIPEELAKENDIGILRFMSIFGDKSYVTGVDITNKQFYEKLRESDSIPTTSQTPYADMYDALKKASDENDVVIYFTMSSKGSGQYNTACMVRDEIKEENPKADIRLFDTMKFSVYETLAVLHAKKLLDGGMEVDRVLEECQKYIDSWSVYILVDTLKYLEKGGRITKTSAIVGALLDIKPVLTIANGLIEPVAKIRGRKKLYKKLIDIIRETPDFDPDSKEFIIVQSNEEYGEEMRALLKEEFGINDVKFYIEFGPVVGTHIGPGTLAVLYRTK